jgi:hypothetical protein
LDSKRKNGFIIQLLGFMVQIRQQISMIDKHGDGKARESSSISSTFEFTI